MDKKTADILLDLVELEFEVEISPPLEKALNSVAKLIDAAKTNVELDEEALENEEELEDFWNKAYSSSRILDKDACLFDSYDEEELIDEEN